MATGFKKEKRKKNERKFEAVFCCGYNPGLFTLIKKTRQEVLKAQRVRENKPRMESLINRVVGDREENKKLSQV